MYEYIPLVLHLTRNITNTSTDFIISFHSRLLRERSHGVPAWCMEMLRDILDKKQLIVVHDDGRPEHRQSALIPNRLLVKPVCSSKFLRRASHSTLLKVSVTDVSESAISASL